MKAAEMKTLQSNGHVRMIQKLAFQIYHQAILMTQAMKD